MTNDTSFKVKAMVRTVLCLQFRQKIIRKDQLAKRAGVSSSEFDVCFKLAASKLNRIFGLDMVGVHKDSNARGEESKCSSWICVNALDDSNLVQNLFVHDESLEKEYGQMLAILILMVHPTEWTLIDLHEKLDKLIPQDLDRLVTEMTRLQYLCKVVSKDGISYKWGPRAQIELPRSKMTYILQRIWPSLSADQINGLLKIY